MHSSGQPAEPVSSAEAEKAGCLARFPDLESPRSCTLAAQGISFLKQLHEPACLCCWLPVPCFVSCLSFIPYSCPGFSSSSGSYLFLVFQFLLWTWLQPCPAVSFIPISYCQCFNVPASSLSLDCNF